jgi:hypothetical protein
MQPDDAYREYVRKLVDEAPPLTEAQRSRLSQLLRPAAARPALPAPREAA